MVLRRRWCTTVLTCLVFASLANAEGRLQVTYSNKGLQQLSYKGMVLEDLDKFPDDTFHIFHLKMTDSKGTIRSSGQYGWGENNSGRTWDPTNHIWTYHFVWGSIRVGFSQHDDSLDLTVTATNFANSGVVLDGAVIYPLALHFGRTPRGFGANLPQLTFNSQSPGVTIADYGNGQVTAVVPDASKPIYSGFIPISQGNVYTPVISGTPPDDLAVFQPHYDRPVAPGQTDTFVVSLRFAESGTSVDTVAADAFENWSRLWPAKLKWTDRRPIGSVYLASSYVSDDSSHPHGYPSNPRRYFNESDPAKLDVKTASGISAFQIRILRQARSTVDVLQRLKAQGSITWDLEGEEYPQETSYVCQPDQIAEISPEMESVITIQDSPYKGMKLDDAYFKIIRDAGFRVGLCIRPQHFTRGSNGSARQVYLPVGQIVEELSRKIRYAHDRWGATLFYIDSTVDENGGALEASILEKVAARMTDSLLIPEEHTEKYYAYAAPFQSFLFHGDTGTAQDVFYVYPNAFSVNMINDVNGQKLAAARQQLETAVAHGDILIVHGDYWDTNNQTIVDIYRDANSSRTGSVPQSKK